MGRKEGSHPRHGEHKRLRSWQTDSMNYRSLCTATVVAYRASLEVPKWKRRKDGDHGDLAEHRVGPRRVGRWLQLERGCGALAGRRIQRDCPTVSFDLTGR